MATDLLTAIIQESLLLLLLSGTLFALLVGLLYALSPARAAALSARYNHWLSLRRPTKPLEAPIQVDSHLYRHHRLLGLVILLSVAYILYRFGFDYHESAATAAMDRAGLPPAAVAWLLKAMLWFLIPVSLLLIGFAAVLALKPSLLKGLELYANRWISTRKVTQLIDKPNYFIDNWLAARPRRFGLLIALGALYSLLMLLLLLFN